MVAAVAIVVALAGVGAWGQVRGWWPWNQPAGEPTTTAGPGTTTTSASATPTPTAAETGTGALIGEGTCLSADAVTLFYDDLRPDDWWSRTTDCGRGTNVEITWVIPNDAWADDSWETTEWAAAWTDCDDATGCWWFSDDGFTYLANTVPTVGTCFYGFLNTAYPERGRSANADILHTATCGEHVPPLDAVQAADTYGLEVSDLVPAEFQIIKLVASGESCPSDSEPWHDITFAPGVAWTVCSVVSSQ